MHKTLSAEVAIDAGLREAVQQAAGLEALRAGRHILRDAQRLRTGEAVIRRLWVAGVQPPAAPPGCLAALLADHQTTVIVAVPGDWEGGSVAARVLQVGPDWLDPVAAALTAFDLWSGGTGIPLAGYSYSLFVDTPQVQAMVRFSNPRDPGRAAVQAALLEVARLFVAEESGTAVAAFLDRWQAAVGVFPTT